MRAAGGGLARLVRRQGRAPRQKDLRWTGETTIPSAYFFPLSYTWACCQEMPLTSNRSSPMSLETYETAVMAVSPHPGAPSGSKDAQPYGGKEGCASQSLRGRLADLYDFNTLSFDSGASPSDPLSTVLDTDIMVDSWLSQQGTHETLSPMYHPRT